MLIVAWFTALLISAPQFAVWRVYEAFPRWSQCMQIWEIIRAEAVIKNNTRINANELMREENIYVVLHILLIFWIPALIVMVFFIRFIRIFNVEISLVELRDCLLLGLLEFGSSIASKWTRIGMWSRHILSYRSWNNGHDGYKSNWSSVRWVFIQISSLII